MPCIDSQGNDMHGIFLFHNKHQPLQISPFGVENVDRMVGRLRQLVDDADVALGFDCSSGDDALEGSLVDGLRAAEGEQ